MLTADQIAERLRPVAKADQHITALWLFGSYAKNRATPTSDVDLAVLPAGELTFTERLDLGSEYATLLDADRLDLLDIRLADAMLRREILQGILIFERDPQRVSNFIEATVNELRHNAYRREQAMRDYFQSIAEAYGDDRPRDHRT